jgi:hypothetical protein
MRGGLNLMRNTLTYMQDILVANGITIHSQRHHSSLPTGLFLVAIVCVMVLWKSRHSTSRFLSRSHDKMVAKKKAAQADKGRGVEDEVEEPLQAVVRVCAVTEILRR